MREREGLIIGLCYSKLKLFPLDMLEAVFPKCIEHMHLIF